MARQSRAVDRHDQRFPQQPALLPAHHCRRERERGYADSAFRRRAADRSTRGPGPELPRASPPRRAPPERPAGPQHADPGGSVPGYSTPNGPFWHRASFDGYGEKADGSEWEPTPTGSGIAHGRGWPLLTGERGDYQLAAGADAQNYLDTIARSADNASLLLPEQVWDHQPPAGTGPDFQPGEPTFSATPLAWTHAQFIRLAWSIDNGAPVETPQPVACRYLSPICGR